MLKSLTGSQEKYNGHTCTGGPPDPMEPFTRVTLKDGSMLLVREQNLQIVQDKVTEEQHHVDDQPTLPAEGTPVTPAADLASQSADARK